MKNLNKKQEEDYKEELAQAKIKRAIERYGTAVEKVASSNQKTDKEKAD